MHTPHYTVKCGGSQLERVPLVCRGGRGYRPHSVLIFNEIHRSHREPQTGLPENMQIADVCVKMCSLWGKNSVLKGLTFVGYMLKSWWALNVWWICSLGLVNVAAIVLDCPAL